MVTITVAQNQDGLYDVGMSKTIVSRASGQPMTTNSTLAADMTCNLDAKGLLCKADKLPVDGALTVVMFEKKGEFYDATMTTTLAQGLQLHLL